MHTASSGSPTRILVVDDDPALLQGLAYALESGGCDVVSSSTYADAREHLRAEQFDVLLTDVRLGAFNGLQLAVIARQAHPELRIIVMSGFDDAVLRADAADLGATYLVKPVYFSRIMELACASEPAFHPESPS